MTTTAGEFDDLQWRNPAPHAAPAAAVTATRAAVQPPEYAAALHDFIHAYKAAIFFTECEELRDACEFSSDAEGTIYAECDLFLRVHYAQLCRIGFPISTAGHDFWLSRNGHGAGFFDRTEYASQYNRNRLQRSAENCGRREAYLGDDGQVHYT